jgi:hypothetical protein
MLREEWLIESVSLMRNRLFRGHGFDVPEKIRISVGFPRGARGGGSGAIGQCWSQVASADEHAEIFIHPLIEDPLRVLDIVAHELVHAVNFAAGQSGHGKVFKDIAVKVGLEGKMTETVAGERLLVDLRDFHRILGNYPHRSLATDAAAGPKKQGTRMLKLECAGCGYVVRTSQKWVDVGLPTCVCGEQLELNQ